MGHIPTKLHQFPTSSFSDFVQTDTDAQALPETIPAHSRHAGNNYSLSTTVNQATTTHYQQL